MKASWWDAPLALQDLAKAIPIISDSRLSLLTENNFQTTPSLLFGTPRLYISQIPPFITTSPIIWNWRVGLNSLSFSLYVAFIQLLGAQN